MGLIKNIIILVFVLFLLVAFFYPEETRELASDVGAVVLSFSKERASDVKNDISYKVQDAIDKEKG